MAGITFLTLESVFVEEKNEMMGNSKFSETKT